VAAVAVERVVAAADVVDMGQVAAVIGLWAQHVLVL